MGVVIWTKYENDLKDQLVVGVGTDECGNAGHMICEYTPSRGFFSPIMFYPKNIELSDVRKEVDVLAPSLGYKEIIKK